MIGDNKKSDCQTDREPIDLRFSGSDSDAIVILEKLPFSKESLGGVLSESTRLEEKFQNDIYHKYDCQPRPELNTVKANLIYPATAKHIAKHEAKQPFIVNETPGTGGEGEGGLWL